MKKKTTSLLQRKRHIVALFTLLIVFVVTGCLFIDSVDITQEVDGQLVDYAKAGTVATFKINGHIDVNGDPRNDKRLVVGIWHKMLKSLIQRILLTRMPVSKR